MVSGGICSALGPGEHGRNLRDSFAQNLRRSLDLSKSPPNLAVNCGIARVPGPPCPDSGAAPPTGPKTVRRLQVADCVSSHSVQTVLGRSEPLNSNQFGNCLKRICKRLLRLCPSSIERSDNSLLSRGGQSHQRICRCRLLDNRVASFRTALPPLQLRNHVRMVVRVAVNGLFLVLHK